MNLYDNDDNSFWGYFGRNASNIGSEVGARGVTFSVWNSRNSSPILKAAQDGSKWVGRHAGPLYHRMAGVVSQVAQPVRSYVGHSGRRIWETVSTKPVSAWVDPTDPEWFTARGGTGPATTRVPRFRIEPGDPAAVSKAKTTLGRAWRATKKVGDVAAKAGSAVKSGAAKAAGWTAGLNEAVGTGLQALPRVSGGTMHRLARQVFSKKGAAVGFFIGGALDAYQGVRSFEGTGLGSRDALDSAYTDGWKIAKTALGRTIRGAARGLDSALFGLPGLIPGFGPWATGGSAYFDGDFEISKSAQDLAESIENMSPDAAAEAVKAFEQKELSNLENGLDADGKKMFTTDSSGGVREFTVADGKREAAARAAVRMRTEAERRMRMLAPGQGKSAVDAASMRAALANIDDTYNQQLDELGSRYENYDAWATQHQGALRGMDRDRWYSAALQKLDSDWASRRSAFTGTQVYGDIVSANRAKALEIYQATAGRMFSPEDIAQRFGKFWDAQEDSFRERFSPEQFSAQLMESYRRAVQAQPSETEE